MTTVVSSEYVDRMIRLPHAVSPVLATGAWLKNTLCVTSGQEALVSSTVGDLDSAEACCAHEETARRLLEHLGEKPAAIAHDLHPDFFSSRLAAQLAAELGVPRVAVQHHHAHIAAVVAEHGVTGPVLGLALDGVGLGSDGSAWGGELLQVDGAEFQRLGHLQPLPLPGGDRAAHEPWRMAAAVLHELGRGDEIARRFADQPAAATVANMLQRGFNCPRTSSMGRAFDAAAGLLGLCRKMEFEAQAAIALEQAAMRYASAHGMPQPLPGGWQMDETGQLNLLPLLAYLADTKEAEQGAALFHATLIAGLSGWVLQTSEYTGIETIACGGGCFFNKLLMSGLRQQFDEAGLKMLAPELMQPGDTAIALGQAWVAATMAGFGRV